MTLWAEERELYSRAGSRGVIRRQFPEMVSMDDQVNAISATKAYGLFEVFTQQWLDQTSIHAMGGDGAYIRSIQDHLSRLLNARQGVLSHLPDYGLPDVTHLYDNSPYTVDVLEKAIALSIDTFEPRLTDVEIVRLPDNKAVDVLIFEIRATLLDGRRTAFETYLVREGSATVVYRPDDDLTP